MTSTVVVQWPPRQIHGFRGNLDALAERASSTGPDLGAEETTTWLARLLVVRSCGYIEQVAKEACRGYVQEKSGGKVRSFAHSWLEQTQIPNPGNLIQLVGRFNSDLSNGFLNFLEDDDQRVRRELAFLVDRRHKIVHGLNENIGLVKAAALKDLACEVGDWFIEHLNPNR